MSKNSRPLKLQRIVGSVTERSMRSSNTIAFSGAWLAL